MTAGEPFKKSYPFALYATEEADAAALEKAIAKGEDARFLAEADARNEEIDALADHYLAKLGLAEQRQTEKDTTMDTTGYASVLDVIKSHKNGVVIFAKQELASDGEPMFTEAEATALVTEHFKIYNRGNPDQAFSKGIANAPEGAMLLKWIQSCKIAG